MSLDELLRSPWFYRSPGPISLAFYSVLILLGARTLLKRVTYHKWRWLNALTESFFLTGFIILTGDFIWMSICAARFLPYYANSFPQVMAVLGRDVAGIFLCVLLVSHRLKEGIITPKTSTFWAYGLLVWFLGVLFAVAPDPTWTDWTYAVRMGCSTARILTTLVVSYGLGKAITAFLVWTWWKS